MRLDVFDLPLSRLVCVDVYSVEVFADVVERFELWIDCAANVSLDAQVEKPRLQPSGGGPFQGVCCDVSDARGKGRHRRSRF